MAMIRETGGATGQIGGTRFGPYADYDPSTGGMPPATGMAPQMDWQGLLGLFEKMGTGGAGANAGLQRAQLDLARQGLGIDRAALERQFPLLQSMYGLKQQALGSQEQAAQYGAQRGAQELSGAAAARGAVTTPGHERRQTDIQKQLADQLAGVGRERESSRLQYEEGVSDVRDALAKLGLRGKELDLQAKQIGQGLNAALKQSKLSAFMSVQDLMAAVTSGNQQQAQQAFGMISYLIGPAQAKKLLGGGR